MPDQNCAHDYRADSSACLECGDCLSSACPQCGAEPPPGARFCSACGCKLSETSSIPKFTARMQVHGGERRQATVVFSDLSGYTEMSEKLDPERVQALMGRVRVGAERIVERHGGTVNQFVGDEVMALFGIPTAHENDPRRAVQAALDLHALVRRLSLEFESSLQRPLFLHTGINTGLVVTAGRRTGDLPDERSGRFSVTGDTVNTTARLASLAGQDEILLSPATWRLANPYFVTEALEPVSVKGKSLPLRPYRVTGATHVRTRLQASKQVGLSGYAGRAVELDTLRANLDIALKGVGRFVTVSGDAGLGKSRLMHEFREALDRGSVNVLEGRCDPSGQATPYRPFLDALRRGMNLQDQDTPDVMRNKVCLGVLELDPEIEPFLPHFLHLLSIPAPEYPLPSGLGGERLRAEFETALTSLMLASARRTPLVWILEDWHWADEASHSLLERLAAQVAGAPVLLVVLYRANGAEDWGGYAHWQAIDLAPLDADAAAVIARAVFDVKVLPPGLVDVVHERTGGNPYFIEEVCHAWREEGVVTVVDGRAKLSRPLDQIKVPGNVEGVIQSRVDRLGEIERRVLRLAAVIGREFAVGLLEAVSDDAALLEPALQGLARQGLIRQVRASPDAVYQFNHALMRQVVYNIQLLTKRRELHGLVGYAIETLYPERMEEHYEALAHHFSLSADADRAIDYLEKAGDKAATVFSLQDARGHYHKSIALADSARKEGAYPTASVRLMLKWAEVSLYTPSPEHVSRLENCIVQVQNGGDHATAARLTYSLSQMFYSMGDLDRAAEVCRQCIDLGEQLQDGQLTALPYTILGRILFFRCEFEQSIEYLRKGNESAFSGGKADESSYSLGYLGMCLGTLGHFAEAEETAQRGLTLAAFVGNPTWEAISMLALGTVRWMRGDWESGERTALSAEELAATVGSPVLRGVAAVISGSSAFMQGRRPEAIALMEEGIALVEGAGSRLELSFCYACLAEAAALDADMDKARTYAEKCLEQMKYGNLYGMARAYRTLALVAAEPGAPDADRIDEYLDWSLGLAAEAQVPTIELPVSLFRNAEILHRRGEWEPAADNLAVALEFFQELHMDWWVQEAHALRARLEGRVPWHGFVPYAVTHDDAPAAAADAYA